MLTIKIYLSESGRIAELKKDFPLYQGSFQNKLLNIFVPTSLIAPFFTSTETDGTSVGSVASTNVEIGMTFLARNGAIKVSKNYYVRYLKTLVYNNIEYALYERLLPKEFTTYAGVGANAPTLVANVVNIQTDVSPKIITSITTTQTCSLDVNESTSLDKDEAIEPSEMQTLQGEMNSLILNMEKKQNKEDNSLTTTSKNIVPAINELNTKKQNVIDNNLQTYSKTIVGAINEIMTSSNYTETFIGTYPSQKVLPTESELNSFVLSNTTPSRNARNGDYVYFTQIIDGATDKSYKIAFSTKGWSFIVIPPIESASNGTQGLVQGTFAIGSTNDLLVNISNGQIIGISFKNNDGVYEDLMLYVNSNKSAIDSILTSVQKIINGSTTIGKSETAIKDQLNNVINTTYARQEDIYTKDQCNDLFLPSTYTNVYYYSANGIVDNIPTTPTSEKQFIIKVLTQSETLLFNVNKTTSAIYNFNKNSTDISLLYVEADRTCNAELKLTTSITSNNVETLLAVDLLGETQFVANQPKLISFQTIYNALSNVELKVKIGDLLNKKLSVILSDGTQTTFTIYSGKTFPSSFQLTSKSVSYGVNYINSKKIVKILESQWVKEGNVYKLVVPQSLHGQAPSTEYGLELQHNITATSVERIVFTPIISYNGDITIYTEQPLDCTLLVFGVGESSTNYISIGNVSATSIDTNLEPKVDIENVIDTAENRYKTNFKFAIPKGDTGLQGPKGDTGLQGPKGDTGLQGPKGDTGTTVVANNGQATTKELTTLFVDSVNYSLPQGGGGGTGSIEEELVRIYISDIINQTTKIYNDSLVFVGYRNLTNSALEKMGLSLETLAANWKTLMTGENAKQIWDGLVYLLSRGICFSCFYKENMNGLLSTPIINYNYLGYVVLNGTTREGDVVFDDETSLKAAFANSTMELDKELES